MPLVDLIHARGTFGFVSLRLRPTFGKGFGDC